MGNLLVCQWAAIYIWSQILLTAEGKNIYSVDVEITGTTYW